MTLKESQNVVNELQLQVKQMQISSGETATEHEAQLRTIEKQVISLDSEKNKLEGQLLEETAKVARMIEEIENKDLEL